MILIGQQIVNTMLWITFAPIALEASHVYNVSIEWVNMLSLICLALFGLGMMWCSYITTQYGLRQVMIVAAAFHCLSGLIRWLSLPMVSLVGGHAAFAVLLLGQAMSAVAQPICTNLPVRLANDWFPVAERDTATTIGNIGFAVGNVIGMGMPGLIVSRDLVQGRVQGMGALLFLEFVICLATFSWVWFCFVEEPASPPSQAAALQRAERRRSQATLQSRSASLERMLQDYEGLWKDRNFRVLFAAFSIALGGFNCLVTVLEQVVHPAGYTFADTSMLGNIYVTGGFITAALAGILLDRTHAYTPVLKIVYIATLITSCNFVLQIRPSNWPMLCISSVLFGAGSVPVLPTTLEVAAEITYPIPGEASTGFLILGGNLTGCFFTYIAASLIQITPSYVGVITPTSVFMAFAAAVATLLAISFNGPYKRQLAESVRPGQHEGSDCDSVLKHEAPAATCSDSGDVRAKSRRS